MKMKFYSLWLVAICVFMFILQLVVPGLTESLLLDKSAYYEPWRFVTAIFLHGSVAHIMYNMLALALFGIVLESVIGGKKFLLVFFSTGIIANIIAMNFYDSSLGASGAIYGVIGALMIIRPFMMVWTLGLPAPMILAGIVWIMGDIVGIFAPSDVANIAHLSGVVVGILFGIILRKSVTPPKHSVGMVQIDESYMKRWEDDYLR